MVYLWCILQSWLVFLKTDTGLVIRLHILYIDLIAYMSIALTLCMLGIFLKYLFLSKISKK